MRRTRSRSALGVACVLGTFLVALPLAAQERGTVTGTVVDVGTLQPLAGTQITVVGTQVGTIANQQGRFIIPNVPAGAREIRASRIGYAQSTQSVNVVAGQTANLEFTLRETALAIDEVVVTATGHTERRRESGNAVGRISADMLDQAAITNVSQVLNARTPGIVVQASSGTTGSSQRIRIRGANSISLANDPLLIVDGVRMNNNAVGLGDFSGTRGVYTGGQTTSRWNDITPDEIESIEIIRGPAAAALYGTAAANGVIQITTKRGRAGPAQWNFFTETGTLRPNTDFPSNFQQIGFNADGDRVSCTLDARVSTRSCATVGDTLYVWQPLTMDSIAAFRNGWRVNHGVSVSGGTEGVTYFIGGELEREQGTLDPNNMDKINLRANLSGRLRDNVFANVTSGYILSNTFLPQNDNNSLGTLGGGLLGTARGDLNSGWFTGRHPSHFHFVTTSQSLNRFTSGLDVNWLPQDWLRVILQAGIDDILTEDVDFTPAGISDYSVTMFEGSRRVNKINNRTVTANLSGTATRAISPELESTSSVGTAFTSERLFGTYSFGRKLLTGTGALGGASEGFAVDETSQEIITVGGYLRQQLAWRDRLFLTGSVRGDDNSAFGQDFDFVIYPALSASWVISEEPFFPHSGAVSSLRLRSAYGQSGQRPRFRQADTFFNPVAATISASEVTAVTIGGTGNAELKPERSSEIEVGFDAGLFDDRASLEFTYYNRTTQDALVARRLAPSLGATITRFENVGQVSNSGLEAALNVNVLARDPVRWDVTVTASRNRNNLDVLGEGVEPIIFNSNGVQRHTEGQPLGSFFQRTYTYQDLDGDGILSRANCGPGQPVNPNIPGCEVVLSETEEFLGTPFPTHEFGFNSSVTLMRNFRLSGQLDYKGGHKQFNYTRRFRCVGFANCEEAHVANTPLADQAAIMASRMGSEAGYIEDADFVKLRELALTMNIPQRYMTWAGTSRASLTIAGRNLWMWTKYSGLDPEVNATLYAGLGNYTTQDFLTMPLERRWTARLNIGF